MQCTSFIYLELFRTQEHFCDLKNVLIDIMKNKCNTCLKMLNIFMVCYLYVWEIWVLAEKINTSDKNAAVGVILVLWSKIQKINLALLSIKYGKLCVSLQKYDQLNH